VIPVFGGRTLAPRGTKFFNPFSMAIGDGMHRECADEFEGSRRTH